MSNNKNAALAIAALGLLGNTGLQSLGLDALGMGFAKEGPENEWQREEARQIAAKAQGYGYGTEIKQLRMNAGYRVYVSKPGYWSFVVSEEDLDDLRADDSLWCKGEM